MAQKDVPAEDLLQRAIANSYKQGAYQVEDSIKDNTNYVKKTLKDQNWAWNRYDKWVDAVQKKNCNMRKLLSDSDTAVDICYTKARGLQEGIPPPNLATIKEFLRFHIAISKGRIGEQWITVHSVNPSAEWFFAGFA